MRFSLIVATIGRSGELDQLLRSLAQQTYRDFELIVVDQNEDDRVVRVLQPWQGRFPIVYLRSVPGLSKARNRGLQYVSGDVVGFPDDDCWYPQELLSDVSTFLKKHLEIDGLVGRCLDESGAPLPGSWDKGAGFINPLNLWRRQRSISIFVRNRVIQTVGAFDESLGLGSGSPWGSGEETDYLLRALKYGYQIYYEPSLTIYHPKENLDAFSEKKALSYARGMGRVLRKHQYAVWFLAYWELRSLAGLVLALIQRNRRKASIHWANLIGRFQGWWNAGSCRGEQDSSGGVAGLSSGRLSS